jgi:hypothetical protein
VSPRANMDAVAKRKKSFLIPGPGRPTFSLVTILTEPSRLETMEGMS